jgi:hypothetical protein
MDSHKEQEQEKEQEKEQDLSSQKHEKKIQLEGQDAQIEELYQAYPKHVRRGHAIKAIRAALKKTSFEVLLPAVKKYAASVTGKDPQFTPHPASWFNGEGWTDEEQKPKSRIDAAAAASARYVEAMQNGRA